MGLFALVVPQSVEAGDVGLEELFPYTAPLWFFLPCYLPMVNAALPSSALFQQFQPSAPLSLS